VADEAIVYTERDGRLPPTTPRRPRKQIDKATDDKPAKFDDDRCLYTGGQMARRPANRWIHGTMGATPRGRGGDRPKLVGRFFSTFSNRRMS